MISFEHRRPALPFVSATYIPRDVAEAAAGKILELDTRQLKEMCVDAQGELIPETLRAVLLGHFDEGNMDSVNQPRRICYGLGLVLAAEMVGAQQEAYGRPPLLVSLKSTTDGRLEPTHKEVRRFLGLEKEVKQTLGRMAIGSADIDETMFSVSAGSFGDMDLREYLFRVGLDCYTQIRGVRAGHEDLYVPVGWQDFINLTRLLEQIELDDALTSLGFGRRALARATGQHRIVYP